MILIPKTTFFTTFSLLLLIIFQQIKSGTSFWTLSVPPPSSSSSPERTRSKKYVIRQRKQQYHPNTPTRRTFSENNSIDYHHHNHLNSCTTNNNNNNKNNNNVLLIRRKKRKQSQRKSLVGRRSSLLLLVLFASSKDEKFLDDTNIVPLQSTTTAATTTVTTTRNKYSLLGTRKNGFRHSIWRKITSFWKRNNGKNNNNNDNNNDNNSNNNNVVDKQDYISLESGIHPIKNTSIIPTTIDKNIYRSEIVNSQYVLNSAGQAAATATTATATMTATTTAITTATTIATTTTISDTDTDTDTNNNNNNNNNTNNNNNNNNNHPVLVASKSSIKSLAPVHEFTMETMENRDVVGTAITQNNQDDNTDNGVQYKKLTSSVLPTLMTTTRDDSPFLATATVITPVPVPVPVIVPEFRNRSRMTPVELEFDTMLEELSCHTNEEINGIYDPRVRSVLYGISASAHDEDIYRAFQVLFEDLYPLKVAGRMIHKKLKNVIHDSIQKQKDDIDTIRKYTIGLDDEQILSMRRLFILVTSSKSTKDQHENEPYITKDEMMEYALLSSSLSMIATKIMGYNTVEDFIDRLLSYRIQNNNSGTAVDDHDHAHDDTLKLDFCSLIVGLYMCVEETCGVEQCDPHATLLMILDDLQEQMPAVAQTRSNMKRSDPERRKHNDRYDYMIHQFREWKHLAPEKNSSNSKNSKKSNSRRSDVIRGCFVGAENPLVVDALRSVYVDYSGLRFAGDIIFNLVSSVLKRKAAAAAAAGSEK